MNKKKLIIIGTIGTTALVGATVIPIVVINSNNDKKNKEDVVAVIKLLAEKSISERTLELASDSSDKIIANNKEKVIKKIKELIGTSKLRGVSISVTMTTDANVSIVEQAIIISIKKGEHSQKLEGKSGLKVKRSKNVEETKIAAIQTYLGISANLNLILSKTNYSNDTQILAAIKVQLVELIKGIEIGDANLITKKADESNVTSIVIHNGEATLYTITVGEEDFTLKLNQAQYTKAEKIKVKIKNKNITLEANVDTSDDAKILVAIKAQLEKDNTLLTKQDLTLITDNISSLAPSTRTFVTLTITIDGVSDNVDIYVTKLKTTAEIATIEINNVKSAIEALTLKTIIISATSGSVTINKAAILNQIQALSGYDVIDLNGVTISIKDDDALLTLQETSITLLLLKDGVTKEVMEFTAKRSKTKAEITTEINNVKSAIEALTLKTIIISATSGSVTINKAAILNQIQALSGYDVIDLNGVTVSIKDDDALLTPQGFPITLQLSKDGVTKEVTEFTAKRSKTKAEITTEINNVKLAIEALSSKTIIISATSGSVTINKAAILGHIQSLNGYADIDLNGVTVSIKDDATTLTPQGFPITLQLSKDGVTIELTEFTVKRSKTKAEITTEITTEINNVKSTIEALSPKTITIDASSGSISDNKENILNQIQSLSGYSDKDIEIFLNGVIVSIKDDATTLTLEDFPITLQLSKDGVTKEVMGFTAKRSKTKAEITTEINNVKSAIEALSSKTIIISATSGSVTINKALILTQIKSLSGYSGIDLNGVIVSINDTDSVLTLEGTPITLLLSKSGVTKEVMGFTAKRSKNNAELANENIKAIKIILDAKIGRNLIITLPNTATGNIISEVANKEAIERELRKLIASSNTDGIINHESLKGTTITVSMTTDSPISTTLQNIIVTISKTNGNSVTTSVAFQVKRLKTSAEIANEDINAIKEIFDAKTGKDLIITLPNTATGNIISEVANKEAIESELRKLIASSNTDGIINHESLKRTTITVSMTTDSPISTTLQNIIVTISKTNGNSVTTSTTFQVKRNQKVSEINADINAIKIILDAKTGNDLIITLPSSFIDDKTAKKDAVEKELRKLIDPLNTDGAIEHASLKGTTVSSRNDFILSTTPQEIVVIISKTGGNSVTTSVTFQVKRNQKVSEINADIDHIWGLFKEILTIKEQAIISIPSTTTGNIIRNNKNIIENTLSKIFDDRIHNTDFISRKKVTITVSVDTDSPISTTPQNIILTISKVGGNSRVITNEFQVKKL